MTGSDERFIDRWSRQKQDAREATDSPVPAPEAEPSEPPAEIDPADLPDIDSLDKDSDYTVFMREGVPEGLKKLALRALWRSDPILANLDGLNDYDEDFGLALRLGAAEMRKFAEAAKRLAGEGEEPPAEEPASEEPAGEYADQQEPDDDPGDETDDGDIDDPIA